MTLGYTLQKKLFLMLLASNLAAEPRVEFIDPVETGPGILPLLELPGALNRDLRHFIAIEPERSNGYLYVHLPGSGGLPENSQQIIRFAAAQGYHAVSLAYPNWPSVGQLTSGLGDTAAPGRVREERLFGRDVSPLVQVDEANGVDNRLSHLLLHLQLHHPLERWDRFLDASGPRWQRIVVGGHSQGAGHAAYLAQEFRLAGAILFAGPGDWVAGVGVADWLLRPLQIDSTRLYGFVHEQDPSYNFYQLTQGILGLDQGGPTQLVDGIPPEQFSSNQLTSARTDIPGDNFHGAVVVDGALPKDPDGSMGYSATWNYMLRLVLFRDDFD